MIVSQPSRFMTVESLIFCGTIGNSPSTAALRLKSQQ
jgi:hypothetical protein